MKLFLILFFVVLIFSGLKGQTYFMTGDIAVVGLNANNATSCGDSSGTDIISFVCFKDFTTGTTLDITDNGYERIYPGLWGDTEGTYRATRTGGTISAGTVITFKIKSGIFSCIYPDANWTFNSINGGWNNVNMNSGGDQLFFMQNGIWSGYADTIPQNATYLGGNILFGFNTRTTWAANGTTQQSNLTPNMDCFNMAPTSGASDFIKYTGSMTDTTQKGWISRISNYLNWTKYTSCTLFNSALPNYPAGVNFVITEFFDVDAGLNDTVCQNQTAFTLGGIPSGGYWTGIGITDTSAGLFDPAVSGAGNSYVTYIFNDAGCSYNDLKTVVVNPKPVVTINSGTGESCEGTDLNITGSITAGTAPFTQLWTGDSSFLNNTVILNPVFNSTSTGNYNLTLAVTDSKGCIGTNSIALIVNPNPTAVILPSSLQICVNEDTILTATPAGGSLVYSTHLWTGNTSILTSSLTQPDVTLNSSSAGNYNLIYTVTDSKGCIGNSYISVTVKASPVLTISPSSQIICSGAETNIELSSNIAGTAFNWTVVQIDVTGASAGSDTLITQSLTNSGAVDGTAAYTIIPIANSCTGASGVVVVTVNPLPVVTINPTLQSICSGDSTNLSLTSNVTNTFYSWSVIQSGVTGAVPDSGSVIAQLLNYTGSPGTAAYSVIGTVGSCAGAATDVIVTVIGAPQAPVAGINASYCQGQTAANITAVAGNGGLLNWFSNSELTSQIGTGTLLNPNPYLTVDTNIFYVTETVNGCISYPASVTIILHALPVLEVVVTENILCFGDSTGSATASAYSGHYPYIYLWQNNLSDSTITGLSANTYYHVTVTDSVNCTDTDSILLTQPSALYHLITTSPVECKGENSGTASVEVNGGTMPYSYLWSDSGTESSINNVPAGNFSLTITDYNNCSVTDSFEITEPTVAISLNVTVINKTCSGSNNGSIHTSTSGGTPPYNFIWSDNQIDSVALNLSTGVYQVTVLDFKNCKDSSSAIVEIYDVIQLTIDTAKNKTSCMDNADAGLFLTVSGGTKPYTYLWSEGSTNKDIFNLSKGEYTVTVTDSLSCSISKSFEIKSMSASCLEIPSAFTPNSDGNNDTWEIKHIELYPDVKVEIFNRWGNVIYISEGYSKPWDGKYNGIDVTTGSYVYIINLNNGYETYKGTITVIR